MVSASTRTRLRDVISDFEKLGLNVDVMKQGPKLLVVVVRQYDVIGEVDEIDSSDGPLVTLTRAGVCVPTREASTASHPQPA